VSPGYVSVLTHVVPGLFSGLDSYLDGFVCFDCPMLLFPWVVVFPMLVWCLVCFVLAWRRYRRGVVSCPPGAPLI